MVLRTTSFVVLLLACPAFAAAATCLVNAQGTGDYPNIGAAMAAAEDGDVIELADGVYTGTGNRDLDFEGKAIVIRSQSADPTACVIDCDGSPGDPHRAFEFMLGEDETSVVEGLTIRGGFAWKGGGLIAYNASPGIVNCIFEDNGADQEGGGIYGYLCGSSISGCTFARNTSPSGGGIYLYQCFGMQISSGTFSGNAATSGSALYCQSSSPTIAHTICVFGTDGEAIGGDQGANPVLTCCDVYGNAGGDERPRDGRPGAARGLAGVGVALPRRVGMAQALGPAVVGGVGMLADDGLAHLARPGLVADGMGQGQEA